MSSVLDRYKRDPKTGDAEQPAEDEKVYSAFRSAGGGQAPHRLVIRKKGAHRAPSYNYLIDIISDPSGPEIGLVFAHMTIKIIGRNLQELVKHLQAQKVEWVQQYDEHWPKPGRQEPFISEIEVFTRDGAPLPDQPKPKK